MYPRTFASLAEASNATSSVPDWCQTGWPVGTGSGGLRRTVQFDGDPWPVYLSSSDTTILGSISSPFQFQSLSSFFLCLVKCCKYTFSHKGTKKKKTRKANASSTPTGNIASCTGRKKQYFLHKAVGQSNNVLKNYSPRRKTHAQTVHVQSSFLKISYHNLSNKCFDYRQSIYFLLIENYTG